MLHIVLLLYLLSFTTGIMVMTILGFISLRRGTYLIKRTILADSVFTLTLIVDAINYYMSIFGAGFSDYVYGFLIAASLIAIIIRTHYILHVVYEIIQKSITKREKRIFKGVSAISISLMAMLFLLYLLHKAEPYEVGRYASSISNTFAVGGNILFAVLLTRYFKNISEEFKPYIKISIIIISIIEPTAFIYNILKDIISFRYYMAFSPLLYFGLNAFGLYFLSQSLRKSSSELVSQQKLDYDVLAEKYNITKREYEIIEQLVTGCSNQKISEVLCLSPHTVRNHVYNIYKKMQVTSKIQLINLVSASNNTLNKGISQSINQQNNQG